MKAALDGTLRKDALETFVDWAVLTVGMILTATSLMIAVSADAGTVSGDGADRVEQVAQIERG